MAKANKDGWIRHRGGKCPVEAGTMIDVRFRDGYIEKEIPALENSSPKARGAYDWSHSGSMRDIMAYRLHKKEEIKPETKIEDLTKLREKYMDKRKKIQSARDKILEIEKEIEDMHEEARLLREEAKKLGYDFCV